VLKIMEYLKTEPENRLLLLKHGGITHGMQFQSPARRRQPTTYYAQQSGVGLLLRHFPRTTNRRIGLVGLGAGTLAAYGRSDDYFRIYEVDPEVIRLARSRFTFLADCPAPFEIIPGDARVSLEREAPQEFDILVLDAFSGDAIPVHLLTREAFAIYERHLKRDGVIAVHVSSRHLKLQPVVRLLADRFNYHSAFILTPKGYGRTPETIGAFSSDWMLLTHNEEFLANPSIKAATVETRSDIDRLRLWTDEESNLFRILKF
jgi:spermidine synthase